jgi:hypothetical protein
MSYKLGYLATVLIILTGFTAASGHVSFPAKSVNYGYNFDLSIGCDQSQGSCTANSFI